MSEQKGMGWVRDLPDIRDHVLHDDEVQKLISKHRFFGQSAVKTTVSAFPTSIDWRQFCPAVDDQGPLGSCTAHAGTGLMEFLEMKAFGKHTKHSRLFLYKVTRWLAGDTGDTGAELRTTMKAIRTFGVLPESHYPYDISKFDDEPGPLASSFAANFQALDYFRLDNGVQGQELVNTIRSVVAGGLAVMFGTTVYDNFPMSTKTGYIPFPTKANRVQGGHAMLIVGYSDKVSINSDLGAFLVRNSWGVNWGESGYGWLPYKYAVKGLATDFWTMSKAEYLDSDLYE